jgi:predicted ATP-dependent endonuclease of OLD family
MKLVKVSISNFRSIINIKEIHLDERITTFVGANEHGKSNLLHAIKYLDRNHKFDFNKDARLDQDVKIHHPTIDYQISLDVDEKKEIEGMISETLRLKNAELEVEHNEGVAVETDIPEVENLLEHVAQKLTDVTLPKNVYTLRRVYQSEIATTSLTDNGNPEFEEYIVSYIEEFYAGRIIYFDDFNDRLPSLIQVVDLADETNLIYKGLMKLSGLEPIKTRIFDDSLQSRNIVRRLFDEAPNKLTSEVLKIWFQGLADDVRIIIHRDSASQTIKVDIEDKNTVVELDSRSRGFKWYFSFFLKYRAYSDGEMERCLFLLDEPGLFLHPRGQKDLLSFFETLSEHNQIIYTTHSPFMINRVNKSRVRVVEKVGKEGTKVNAKGFIFNWRPLRSSLGLTLSDSFFYADNTLLVEGPEDKIYVLSLLLLYSKVKDVKIDLNILSIMDCGGIGEMPAMARIIGEEDRPFIVLVDSDSQKSLNKLKKAIKKQDDLREVKDFKKNALVIQELLPPIIYAQAVNNYVDSLVSSGILILKKNTTKHNFELSDSGIKLDKQVEEFVNKLFGDEDISKVGVAVEFEKIILSPKFSTTGHDFESAFKLVDWVITRLKLKDASK